jgi:hypothetical protein
MKPYNIKVEQLNKQFTRITARSYLTKDDSEKVLKALENFTGVTQMVESITVDPGGLTIVYYTVKPKTIQDRAEEAMETLTCLIDLLAEKHLKEMKCNVLYK